MRKPEYSATLRRMLRYIRPYRVLLALSVLTALLSVVSMLVFPLLTGRAVDSISRGEWKPFIGYVAMMAASAGVTSPRENSAMPIRSESSRTGSFTTSKMSIVVLRNMLSALFE